MSLVATIKPSVYSARLNATSYTATIKPSVYGASIQNAKP